MITKYFKDNPEVKPLEWHSVWSVGRKDVMILALGVRIPLWDVGAGLSDETV
jgi:hypothetical protein